MRYNNRPMLRTLLHLAIVLGGSFVPFGIREHGINKRGSMTPYDYAKVISTKQHRNKAQKRKLKRRKR